MTTDDSIKLSPAQPSDVGRLTDILKASFAMAPEWRAPRFMINAWWTAVLGRPDASVVTLRVGGSVRGFVIYVDTEAAWDQIESSGPNRKAVKLLVMLTNPSVLRSRLAKRRKARAAKQPARYEAQADAGKGTAESPPADNQTVSWRESEFFLGLIATDPTARGRGLGTALLGACEQIARERGKDLVRIYSDPRNERVHRLYQRLGYRRAGILGNSVVMVKNLNA